MFKFRLISLFLIILTMFVYNCGDYVDFIEIRKQPVIQLPLDNEKICKDEITFTWKDAGAGVDDYLLEINGSVYGITKETSYKINTAELKSKSDTNEYKWKIIARNEFQLMPSDDIYIFYLVGADDPFISIDNPCQVNSELIINFSDTSYISELMFNNKKASIDKNKGIIKLDSLLTGIYSWSYKIKVDECSAVYKHNVDISVDDTFKEITGACEGNGNIKIEFTDANNVKDLKFDGNNVTISNNQALFNISGYNQGTYDWTYTIQNGLCTKSFTHSTNIEKTPILNNLTSPVDGNAPYTNNLSWNYVSEPPDNYEVELIKGTCSSLNQDIVWSTTTTQTTISTGELNPIEDTVYSWRIRAKKGNCYSNWICGDPFNVLVPPKCYDECPTSIGPLTWTQLPSTGTYGVSLYEHAGAFDYKNNYGIVLYIDDTYLVNIGNTGANVVISDITTSTFNAGFPYLSIQHVEHNMIYDPERERMVVFSPGKWENDDQDTYILPFTGSSIGKWELLSVTGTKPTERAESAMVYDCKRECMWVFGGEPGPPFLPLNDLWYLDFSTTTASWNEVTPISSLPTGRGAHDMAYLSNLDMLVVIGGRTDNSDTTWAAADYLWKYDIQNKQWIQITPSGSGPSHIHEHSVTAIDGCRVLVASGYTGDNTTNPYSFIRILNVATNTWENVTINGTAPTTHSRTGTYSFDPDEKVLYYFGGEINSSNVWKLSGF